MVKEKKASKRKSNKPDKTTMKLDMDNKTSKSSKIKKPKSTSAKASSSKNSGVSNQSKKPRVSLDPLRKQLAVLVDQANARVDDIARLGLPSRAILEATRTWNKMPSRRDDTFLFKSDLKRRCDIDREFARVHEFLNDFTSTVQGAKQLETDLNRLKGAWSPDNQGSLDEQIKSKTFDLYRRVLEAAGGWERAVGLLKGKETLTGYGSENLINNIYDMVENEYNDEKIIAIALEQVESGIEAYEEMSKRQVANYDYGIVFDDETTIARRNWYINRRKFKRGEL